MGHGDKRQMRDDTDSLVKSGFRRRRHLAGTYPQTLSLLLIFLNFKSPYSLDMLISCSMAADKMSSYVLIAGVTGPKESTA